MNNKSNSKGKYKTPKNRKNNSHSSNPGKNSHVVAGSRSQNVESIEDMKEDLNYSEEKNKQGKKK